MSPRSTMSSYKDIASVLSGFELFSEGFVSVDAADVVPGQPIDIEWAFVFYRRPEPPDHLRLRVLVDGRQVLERQGIVIQKPYERTKERLSLSGEDKLRIYRFGAHTATVELVSERGVVWRSGSDRFRVVREPIDRSWWAWRGPPFQSVKWKEGYSLIADFHNRCRFANLSVVTAELSEVRSEEDPNINPCDFMGENVQHLSHIRAGQKAALTFHFKHAWSWFYGPGFYLFKGPINKTFAYAAFVSVVDEFGNSYQPFCSSRIVRHVGVSKAKRLAFVAAQSASVAALWEKFVSKAIATGMALLAKDPPEPDFDPSLPPEGSQTRRDEELLAKLPADMAAIRELFRSVMDVLSTEAYRTVVRSKMLGALASKDRDGFARLSTEYERVHERLSAHADSLREVAQKAANEFESQVTAQRDIADSRSAETTNSLATYLRSDEIAEVIDAELNPIPVLATAVCGLVDELLSERDAVLEGEEYIHAESFDDIDMGDSDSGVKEPILRRGGCSC